MYELNRRTVTALLLVFLLIGSPIGANLSFAETKDGGSAPSIDATAAPAIDIPDAVIDDTSDSTITVSYAISENADLSDYEIQISGPNVYDNIVPTSHAGTVEATIPAGRIGGGSHYFQARLVNKSGGYDQVANDHSLITAESSVTVESADIADGPHYANDNITATVTLQNPTDVAQQYTLALYEQNSHRISLHYDRNAGRNALKTVTVPANAGETFTLNTSWSHATDNANLRVNNQPSETFTVESPLVVDSLSLNVSTASVGERVAVTAEIRNAHGGDGTYPVSLHMDGRRIEQKEVTFASDGPKTISFTPTLSTSGEHTLSVGEKQASITVTNPVKATSLTTVDEPVYAQTDTQLAVTVVNTGDVKGTFPVTAVNQHGMKVGQTDVTLGAGESTTIPLTVTLEDYEQTLSVLNKSLSVTPQLPFSVGDASLATETLEVGEQTTLSVNVTNDHAPTDTYRLDFRIGNHHEGKEVKLPHGETTTVDVPVTFEVGGERTIRLFDEEIATATVTNPLNVTSVTPPAETIYTRNSYTFETTVVNTGSKDGEYPVTLVTEWGEVVATKTVTIGAGATKTVSLDASFSEAGSNTVRFNNRSLSLDIKPALNVTDYSFSSDEFVVGKPVTLTVNLTNEYGPDGQYGFDVSAYPNYYERKEVSLANGESTTLTYTFDFDTGGEHRIRIGESSFEVDVTNPVNVTDYEFNQSVATVGKPVQLTVNATNTGETAGVYPVALKHEWQDTVYGKKVVHFEAGESRTVTLNATFNTAKHHSLHLNNQTDVGLTVTSPVRVLNYSFSKNEVYTYEDLTVTANVTNTGSAGSYTLALKRWGHVVGSTTVDLAAGETKEVSFTVTPQNPVDGQDRVSLGDTAVDTLRINHRIVEDRVVVNDGVKPGEEASIEVTYTNPTDKEASTYVDTVLGDEHQQKSITLQPGETMTVTMTGSYATPGRHYEHLNTESVPVYVFNDTTGTPNLTIENQYFPTEAVVGESMYIPVEITNEGDAAGVTDVTVSVDGEQIDSERAYAEPGESNYVGFQHTFEETGSHTVTVNGETFTVDVLNQVVVDSSVEYLSGAEPVANPEVQTQYSQYGVYVALTATDGFQDLARMGADTSSKFRVNVTLEDYTPRVLLNTGNDTDWSTTKLGPNKTRVSVLISPSELQYRSDPPMIENWVAENDTADHAMKATAQMRIGNGEYSAYDVDGSTLSGMTISTDAQRFRQPLYHPGTGETSPYLEVKFAGPHRTVEGNLNQGHYNAFLPAGLLDAWNVSDPQQLTVDYIGESDTEYTIEEVDGGLDVHISVHYSSGAIRIMKSSTEDTESGTDPGDDTSDGDGSSSPGTTEEESTTEEDTTTTTEPESTPTTTEDTVSTTEETETIEDSPGTSTTETEVFEGQPGFDLLVGLVGLLAFALLAMRRK